MERCDGPADRSVAGAGGGATRGSPRRRPGAGSVRPLTPERRRPLRLPPHLVDDAEDAGDFLAVPDHVAVAGLAPAQQAVAVDDEGRAVGDVPLHVVDAVGLDDLTVDIAQEWEGEAPGLGEGL